MASEAAAADLDAAAHGAFQVVVRDDAAEPHLRLGQGLVVVLVREGRLQLHLRPADGVLEGRCLGKVGPGRRVVVDLRLLLRRLRAALLAGALQLRVDFRRRARLLLLDPPECVDFVLVTLIELFALDLRTFALSAFVVWTEVGDHFDPRRCHLDGAP